MYCVSLITEEIERAGLVWNQLEMHILWFSTTLGCPCSTYYRTCLGLAWEVLFNSCIEIKHTVLKNYICMQVQTWICLTLGHNLRKLKQTARLFNQKIVCCTKGLLGLQLGELRGSRPLWWSIDFKDRVCLWHMHTLFGLGWTQTVAPGGEEGNPFNSSHAETRWNKAGTTWKG